MYPNYYGINDQPPGAMQAPPGYGTPMNPVPGQPVMQDPLGRIGGPSPDISSMPGIPGGPGSSPAPGGAGNDTHLTAAGQYGRYGRYNRYRPARYADRFRPVAYRPYYYDDGDGDEDQPDTAAGFSLPEDEPGMGPVGQPEGGMGMDPTGMPQQPVPLIAVLPPEIIQQLTMAFFALSDMLDQCCNQSVGPDGNPTTQMLPEEPAQYRYR